MTTKKFSFVRLSALLALCLGLFFTPRPVQAATTITVNTATDGNDGSCTVDNCSLREAIAAAASGDTITFAGDYTIYLNSQLSITKTLTIDGGSHVVTLSGDTGNDGTKDVRVISFNLTTGTLTLNHLTITNGYTEQIGGGGVYIFRGNLVVRNSTFLNNSSNLDGGAIANESYGSMTIENCTFSGNTATSTGSAGGAVLQFGPLTLTNSTFFGNSAVFGGGLYIDGTLTMTNTLLANNTNRDCYLRDGTTNGNHNLIKSDSCGYTNGVNGNITGVDPLLSPLGNYGGVTQTFALLPGSPAIDAGSSCPSADQRGISRPSGTCDIGAFESQGFSLTSASDSPQSTAFNTSFASPLVVSVASGHSEPVDGGIVTFTAPSSGASISPATGSATISAGSASYTPTANSIGGTYTVSATTRGNTGSAALFTLKNLVPEIAVSGSSDITSGDTTPSTTDGTDFGSINGGLKPAHTFTIHNTGEANLTVSSISLSGSQAAEFSLSGFTANTVIAPGKSTTFTVSLFPTDHGLRSAIVSITNDDADESTFTFAIQGTRTTVGPVVTTATDENNGECDTACSLREAIALAFNGETITFNGDYTINLSSSLSIGKPLTIDGSAHTVTVSGGNAVRVFYTSSTITLSHLSIANGKAPVGDINGKGGGIYNTGILTLAYVTLSGNSGTNGGAIYNNGSSITIENSTFTSNSATESGGAINNYSNCSLTIENSTFASNSANSNGGAIENYGTATLRNSTLSGNSAQIGAGVNNHSTLNLTNTIFADSASGYDCHNVSGSIGTNSHNLFESNHPYGWSTCGLQTSSDTGTTIGVDLLLGPLGNYDGETQTFALLPGSPAIDRGSACLAADQRGIARPSASCDIGAFESQGFTLAYASGSSQSALVGTAFASPLVVSVASSHSEPVNGGRVTFQSPASGAGTNPRNNAAAISGGQASLTPTANTTGGNYTVSAATAGYSGSPASFYLTNTQPEIDITGNSASIVQGDTTPSTTDGTDFGTLAFGQAPVAHVFTITNTGDGQLTVSKIGFTGSAAADYAVSGITLPAVIAPSASTTFTLTFTPSAVGDRLATVTVNNTDSDESAYTFAVSGVRSPSNLVVNTPVDENDGECDTDCSLRDAVALSINGDTITFNGDTAITLASPLEINKALTIDGGDHAIALSGGGSVRILSITGNNVTLMNLSLSNGASTATSLGGAITNAGTLTLSGVTLSANSAIVGGAIYNTGVLTIQNSTFADNSVSTYGGAIANAGTLSLSAVTLSGNAATTSGGAIYNAGTLNLTHTLIANSPSGSDCINSTSGKVGTNDHNLIESTAASACGLANAVNGDIIGTDPLLTTLGAYNGKTQTFALLPGSPAIGAGNASTCLSLDQRNVARTSGEACDIGAFESQGFTLACASGNPQSALINTAFASPLTLTVSSSASEPVDGGWVTFTAPGSGASISSAVNQAVISDGKASFTPSANAMMGSYTVSATIAGNTGSAINYSLTNLAPDLSVSGKGLKITSGNATPSVTNDTDFGHVKEGDSLAHAFTLNNTGNAPLTITGISLSGANPGDFAVSGITFPAAVAPGSSADLTLTFTPDQAGAAGVRSAVISIESDDGDESPFTFAVQGSCGDLPEITILGNGLPITNGNNTPVASNGTDFGELFVGQPLTRIFTVSNPGDADLTLSQITLTGSTDFSTSGLSLPAVIAPGANASFTVTLTPALTGAQTAVLSISSDAPGASPYTFSLKGQAIPATPSKFYVFLPVVLK